MRYLFLLNPAAGRQDSSGQLLPALEAALARAVIAPEQAMIQRTAFAGHARGLVQAAAQRAAQEGEDLRVYTAGGDGTLSEALSGACPYPNAAVGCLPYGSGNDFLRSFGAREEFLDLDAQLAGGVVPIDLMETSLGLSATICAAGLDAQVACGIPKFRRLPFCGGEMAYLLSIAEQVVGPLGRGLRVEIDGEVLEENCLMCAVCNGRAYGGGFMAAPEAALDDGWLDVFIIRAVGRLTIAKMLGIYKKGRHFRQGHLTEKAEPYFIYRRARQVSLCPVDGRGPIAATADGECAELDSLAVRVRPLAGRIILPGPVYSRFEEQKTVLAGEDLIPRE